MIEIPLHLRAAYDGYVQCALWIERDDDGEPFDRVVHAPNVQREFSLRAQALMLRDLMNFIADNIDDVIVFGKSESFTNVGHDLWLTRNGHGSGFWDRGYGDLGDRLTAAAHAMGETHLYVGDDGRIEVSP